MRSHEHRIADDARFWNRAARKYAAAPIKDMTGYERTLERAAELLGATDSVLEVGCGTGTTALRLAPRVDRIVATDLAEEMIAIARRKAVDAGCRNVTFEVAEAGRPMGRDGEHDAVLAFNVLHLIADRRAMLAEAYRVLRPGGLLVSKTTCLTELNRLVRLAVPVMRWIGKAPYVDFFDARELEAEIAAAGFVVSETARHGATRKDARIFIVARK